MKNSTDEKPDGEIVTELNEAFAQAGIEFVLEDSRVRDFKFDLDNNGKIKSNSMDEPEFTKIVSSLLPQRRVFLCIARDLETSVKPDGSVPAGYAASVVIA